MLDQALWWLLIYALGYLRWEWPWAIVLLASAYFLWRWQASLRKVQGDSGSKKDLPSWVLHPDMQRLEWVNLLVSQIWPYLDGVLKAMLKSFEDDPDLRVRLNGYHIKTLRFSHCSLGRIPPRMGGVKVHNISSREEIILDVDMDYAGDLVIHLEATMLDSRLPTLRVSLSNLTLSSARMRFHLKPLLSSAPFVGSVTISFLTTPELDFDLGGFATALDLPGVALLLRHLVQDQLEQAVVMPNSFTLRLVPDEELTDLIHQNGTFREKHSVSLPRGVLTLHLIEAKSLRKTADPYAILRMYVDGASHCYKTGVERNSAHPHWNLMLDLPVDDDASVSDVSIEASKTKQKQKLANLLGFHLWAKICFRSGTKIDLVKMISLEDAPFRPKLFVQPFTEVTKRAWSMSGSFLQTLSWAQFMSKSGGRS